MAEAREIKNVKFMLYGEELAHAVATLLAEKMPHPMLRRAYARQAQDEARHAALFREYLRRIGADSAAVQENPGLDGYRRFLIGAAESGHLTAAVMGMNVALEGLSCVGFDISARWVEGIGGDPAWVALMRAIERDERRHIRLALPALRSLGGGVIPREAKEAMSEARDAAAATLENMGAAFARWGIDDPMALFDSALGQVHSELVGALIDRRQA